MSTKDNYTSVIGFTIACVRVNSREIIQVGKKLNVNKVETTIISLDYYNTDGRA